MLAIVEEDVIVKLVISGGVEIGTIPKDVGLERLRFTGETVVDLATLSTIWVRQEGFGSFSFHAIPVYNSQPVSMTWADRKRVKVSSSGIVLVQTDEEVVQELTLLNTKRRLEKALVKVILLIEDVCTALATKELLQASDLTEDSRQTIIQIRALKDVLESFIASGE